MKQETKRAIDDLATTSSIKEMTYDELGKFLSHLGWKIDWILLGQIYEYLQNREA